MHLRTHCDPRVGAPLVRALPPSMPDGVSIYRGLKVAERIRLSACHHDTEGHNSCTGTLIQDVRLRIGTYI